MSQYTISHSSNCLNTTDSYNNVWNNCTVADDRSELLTWLSPLDPGLRHWDIQERRVNDVEEWLIQSEEFRRWCGLRGDGEADKAVLFRYGDPGVCKTFISSLVVDWLCDQARDPSAAVPCFYFDFAARKEHSATSMLGSLLKQIVSGMESIPVEIWRALQAQKKAIGGRRPQLADIVRMLQLITSSQSTFMCIDALDECAGVQRVKLLDSLSHILEKSPGTRIFVTGRPHIRAKIEKRLDGKVASVSVSPTRQDIITYLRVRLGEDETPDAMNKSLEADILAKIPENISEMFLLVSLNIDAILQESTIYRRRERLSRMTDGSGLEDAYSATIERIKMQGGDKSRLGMAALMWISHAERPLKAEELCRALAIELGSRGFNSDNAPSISTLAGCCQGLITVDKEGSTVRLVHFTLKEYLSAHPDIFGRPHSTMAEICLTYLNSQQVKAIPTNRFPDIRDIPFLEYCIMHWGAHARRDLSDRARSLSLELFREYDGHISGKLLLTKHLVLGPWLFQDLDTGSLFSGLHCASFFGIVGIINALIGTGYYDISSRGLWGYTPLVWAARNGHEEVVKIVLEREDVNPDEPDDFGKTPLSHAASSGHEEVVKMLLRQEGVNPDKLCDKGKTPLMYAAWRGHKEVVKILLMEEGVNPDKLSEHGETPLSLASEGGGEGVVKILLSREEVNPNRPDMWGRKPLLRAAAAGDERVVKILLEREEVNPAEPDKDGRTPLSYAACYGYEEVVKILLEREEVSPDEPDKDGRTPLSYAACYGHGGVVNILLEREEVSPGKPDNDGRTPLSYATEEGEVGVKKILLRHEEVNPTSQITAAEGRPLTPPQMATSEE